MSNKYEHSYDVPTDVIADRLDELATAVTKKNLDEFDMRIPAELDRDADLVLSEAARRLRAQPSTASLIAAAIREEEKEWRAKASATENVVLHSSRDGFAECYALAAQIAEQYSTVTLEPVGWCVEDKDGDAAGSVTSEKIAKQYEKQWNHRSHEAEISDSGYPYKAVQLYRVKGE